MKRSPVHVTALAALGLALVPACHRVVDEPSAPAAPPSVSASVPSATTSTTNAALAGRCVTPLPDSPPPEVHAVSPERCPPDPNPGYTLALGSVEFPEATAGRVKLDVELARSPGDNERGLMYRTSMPEGHGMWFDDGEHRVHTFWMHNTCIPLDLLFLDDDGLIVGIAENAPTLNDGIVAVPCASSYVLEVNAGWSRRHGVKPGQRAIIPPRA